MKRLLLILGALLACGLIAAGCGGDDDDGGDDSPAATTETPLEIEPTDDEGADDVTPPEDVDSIEEAVEACKEGVQSSSAQLSEDLRNDLEDICEQAAEGDEEELREASLDICRRVVEETVPEGPGRDQALDACEASVPTP
jgi:hypothetical protein